MYGFRRRDRSASRTHSAATTATVSPVRRQNDIPAVVAAGGTAVVARAARAARSSTSDLLVRDGAQEPARPDEQNDDQDRERDRVTVRGLAERHHRGLGEPHQHAAEHGTR